MQFKLNKHSSLGVRLVFIYLLAATSSFGQNKNHYLEVISYNPSFSFSNVTDLETQKVRSNALQLNMVSRSQNINLSARVYTTSGPNGTGFAPSLFFLRLNSISPSLPASYSTIALSNADQLVQAVQTPSNFWQNNSMISLNYDLLLGPIGYNYPAGSYTTTILFTMTEL